MVVNTVFGSTPDRYLENVTLDLHSPKNWSKVEKLKIEIRFLIKKVFEFPLLNQFLDILAPLWAIWIYKIRSRLLSRISPREGAAGGPASVPSSAKVSVKTSIWKGGVQSERKLCQST